MQEPYRLPRSHSSTSFPPGRRRGAGSGGVAVTHLVPIRLTRPEWAPRFGFPCARIRAFTRRLCGGLAAQNPSRSNAETKPLLSLFRKLLEIAFGKLKTWIDF